MSCDSIVEDKRRVLAAVRIDGFRLEYASARLQNHKAAVLAAVKECGTSLGWASARLRNDKAVVLAAVKRNGIALGHASKRLQNHKAAVIAAVKEYGLPLKWASARLRGDKKVVLVAVKARMFGSLQYASARLQDGTAAVHSAVKAHGGALVHASGRLRGNMTAVLAAVDTGDEGGAVAQFASARLRNDKRFALAAVKKDGCQFAYVPAALQRGAGAAIYACRNRPRPGWHALIPTCLRLPPSFRAITGPGDQGKELAAPAAMATTWAGPCRSSSARAAVCRIVTAGRGAILRASGALPAARCIKEHYNASLELSALDGGRAVIAAGWQAPAGPHALVRAALKTPAPFQLVGPDGVVDVPALLTNPAATLVWQGTNGAISGFRNTSCL